MVNDQFSARDVGALIESLRSEFRVIAEAVVSLLPLKDRMEKVENRLSRVEDRLTNVEDVIRAAFPAINQRFTRIEAKLGII